MMLKQAKYLVEGALEYAKAWASGDRATAEQEAKRAAACARCRSVFTARTPMTNLIGKAIPGMARAAYCGQPLQDNMDQKPPTCGCPVLAECAEGETAQVTINGVPMKAHGSTRVGSKKCPQELWD